MALRSYAAPLHVAHNLQGLSCVDPVKLGPRADPEGLIWFLCHVWSREFVLLSKQVNLSGGRQVLSQKATSEELKNTCAPPKPCTHFKDTEKPVDALVSGLGGHGWASTVLGGGLLGSPCLAPE